jgi:hypothetical protein
MEPAMKAEYFVNVFMKAVLQPQGQAIELPAEPRRRTSASRASGLTQMIELEVLTLYESATREMKDLQPQIEQEEKEVFRALSRWLSETDD